ncbi:MAG: hypothetical protein M1823_004074 [Watsoniomyces obsoletus]|nr:MAG: hypothetical protein M1823_004074 [Watsoniomyces obsoletus]
MRWTTRSWNLARSIPKHQLLNLQSLLAPWAQTRPSSTVAAANLKFGQPLHETHPHLLKPGEITPGISALEYATRRAKLAAQLPRNGVAIVAASELKYRSGVVFYEFHQDPDFFYLTGFKESDAVAVIEKTGSNGEHVFHLFVQPKDAAIELWEGACSGIQAAQDVFNADEARAIHDLPTELTKIASRASKVYTDLVARPKSQSAFSKLIGERSVRQSAFAELLAHTKTQPLRPLLHELRVRKSEGEIANMRAAGKASGRAITNAMSRSFSTEKALAAFIEYQFKEGGCDTSAYVPVVAGGEVISVPICGFLSGPPRLTDAEWFEHSLRP